jgi:hypothetical protein
MANPAASVRMSAVAQKRFSVTRLPVPRRFACLGLLLMMAAPGGTEGHCPIDAA